ncbi:MAG: NRDE family protein [Flavobacteriaceae bacterium]|nr:NRDE family protein [Flavobacteriaceae bacterium]
MCTVTYLPLPNNNFILTSNRDVPFSREKALAPKTYKEDGINITYPKDGKAGGTWIGLSEKKRLICLLNGGYEYHTSRNSYRMSRGVILKALLKSESVLTALDELDLTAIEQFTLVIVDWQKDLHLYEFVWDGTQKHLKKLAQEPHIWSSSTLYDPSVKKLRENWFTAWQNQEFTTDNILKFHHTAGIGDSNIDVLMNRGLGGTVSITSVKKNNDSIEINYEDVLTDKKSLLKL